MDWCRIDVLEELGHYIATKRDGRSVATSTEPRLELGRYVMLGHRVSIELGLSAVRSPYSNSSTADLDTCPLPSDNRI